MIAVIDIIYIGLFLILAIRGWMRGFVKEVFSLCSLLLAFFLSLIFFRSLSLWAMKQWGDIFWITPASFLVIFMSSYLGLKIMETILDRMLSASVFHGPDRILGFLLGSIEGLIFCMVLTVALLSQPFFDLNKIFDSSLLAVWILKYLPVVQEISRNLIKNF